MAAFVMMQTFLSSVGERNSMDFESHNHLRWRPLPVLEDGLGPDQHRVVARISLRTDVL